LCLSLCFLNLVSALFFECVARGLTKQLGKPVRLPPSRQNLTSLPAKSARYCQRNQRNITAQFSATSKHISMVRLRSRRFTYCIQNHFTVSKSGGG
jgi:hypothetical protein